MRSKIDKSAEELIKHIVPLILENYNEAFSKVGKMSVARFQFTLSVSVCTLFPVVPEALVRAEDDVIGGLVFSWPRAQCSK